MKHEIESLLQAAVVNFFALEQKPLPSDLQVTLERPRDPSHGDYSCNVAMVLAKVVGMPPRVLAERLKASMPEHPDIEGIEIAGPGFINLRLSKPFLEQQFKVMMLDAEHCGVQPLADSETVVVDYSSPNLAKEMHVGHLRSTIIGDALARVLELKGYCVIRQNHVGDWGTQFGMLLAHLEDQMQQQGEMALNDLESFYKAAKSRFDQEEGFAERARSKVVLLQSEDPACMELWSRFIKLSLTHCQEIYDRLGVSLTEGDVKAESAYNSLLPGLVDKLRKQGLLIEHDGAQCVFLPEFIGKDDVPLPVIVQKKDGGFLYASTDLAAVDYRQNTLHADRILYVVDIRQSLHFQQIFALARKAGFAKPDLQLEHVSFGMVLDKSGKPFKSREGGVTKLVDLLDEAEKRSRKLIESKQTAHYSAEELEEMATVLGIAAIKYADLSKNRTSDYIFDWDQMISFEGNTAPYLLYAYTRINSIFKKAEMNAALEESKLVLEAPQDTALLKQLLMFPEVVDTVAHKAAPHLLCTYLYELAGIFSSFYEACPILNQENEALRGSRLNLAKMTARVLKLGLSLLGIKTLARM